MARYRKSGQGPYHTEHKGVPRHDFDLDSGLVYNETELVYRRQHHSDWIGELRSPLIAKKPPPASRGSRSLADCAKTKCVEEFRNFTPQHFEAVPWSITSRLWAEAATTHHESFHMWKTLATIYNQENDFSRPANRYLLQIRQPPLPVRQYFDGVNSSSLRWLSALRISPKQISDADLVAIASITNLAVLDLSDGQLLLDATSSHLDERVFRTWAELATSGRAFQHLRVLLLGWQDIISHRIFDYLDAFPNLSHFIVTDCKYLHQRNRDEWEERAIAYGWTAHHAKRSVKRMRPLLDDKHFQLAAVSSFCYYAEDDSSLTLSQSEIGERILPPIIECWLGTPRPWTHILDEYPGTRTVWFEKLRNEMTLRTQVPTDPAPHRATDQKHHRLDRISKVPLSATRPRTQDRSQRRPRAPVQTVATLLADLG